MIPKRKDYKEGPLGLLAYSMSLEDCLRAAHKKLKENKIKIEMLESTMINHEMDE